MASTEEPNGGPAARDVQPQAGDNVRRIYDARRAQRERRNIERFGSLGEFLTKISDDPQTTRSIKHGSEGERLTQASLEKRLRGTTCEMLHCRQFPGGGGDIDHIVIGPGGVTVIDSKNIAGKVRVRSTGIGRLRHERLTVNGHNRSKLIDGVLEQVAALEGVLSHIDPPMQLPVAGAICWTDPDGIPLFGTLSVRGVGVFHPRKLAKFVSRPGDLDLVLIQFVADYLDRVLTPA